MSEGAASVASYEERIEIPASPQELTQRLYHALAALRGSGLPVVQGPWVSTEVGMTLMSWGERVTALVQPGPHACLVTVKSTSTFALIDWGRNKKHVTAVLARIAAPLPPQPAQPYGPY